MHERYGIAAVTGTLLGSKRARLKEIGADSYSSYGALKGRSEGDLRLLLRQMVSLGYLIQTEGEYSVLKLGDIEAFQDKNVNITIKKFEEKPSVSSRSQRFASSSGKAGRQPEKEQISLKSSVSFACRLQRKKQFLLISFLQTKLLWICATSFQKQKLKCWTYQELDRTS